MLKADNPVELAWGQGARLEERRNGVVLIAPWIDEDEFGRPVLTHMEAHRFSSMEDAMKEAVDVIEWQMALWWN